MNKNLIHIPDTQMEALARTAALGNFGIEDLVGVAAWAFAQNKEDFKSFYVHEFLYNSAARPEKPRPRKTIKEKLHGLARRIRSLIGQNPLEKE